VFKIEPVNQAAATGVAGAASDAGILDDARIPQNLLARNAMPRLGEVGVGHRAFSCRFRLAEASRRHLARAPPRRTGTSVNDHCQTFWAFEKRSALISINSFPNETVADRIRKGIERALSGLDNFWKIIPLESGLKLKEWGSSIVAKEGASDAPAYRGVAYVVFERLPLEEYQTTVAKPLAPVVDLPARRAMLARRVRNPGMKLSAAIRARSSCERHRRPDRPSITSSRPA
jgi:hypothetical protein